MGELKFSVHSTNRNKLSLIGGLRRTPPWSEFFAVLVCNGPISLTRANAHKNF